MCVTEREKWQYYAAFWWSDKQWNCRLYNNHTLNLTVCSGILFQLIAVELIVLKLCCCWQNSAVAVLVVTSPLVWGDLLRTKRETVCVCVATVLLVNCIGSAVIDRSSMQSSTHWHDSTDPRAALTQTHAPYHTAADIMCECVFTPLAKRFHRKNKLPHRAHAYMWVNNWEKTD